MSNIPGLGHNKRGCGARYPPLCNIKIKRPYAFLRLQNARVLVDHLNFGGTPGLWHANI